MRVGGRESYALTKVELRALDLRACDISIQGRDIRRGPFIEYSMDYRLGYRIWETA